MIIKVEGRDYKITATKTMDCPAGTAYWIIAATEVHDRKYDQATDTVKETADSLATASIETRAIYGPPTLANYIDELGKAIKDVLAKLTTLSL